MNAILSTHKRIEYCQLTQKSACQKVVKYRHKTRQRTHDSVNSASASAAASVDERVGPEMDEREAHPGDEIERETERTMLEGRF
jgi:hypothetical protein